MELTDIQKETVAEWVKDGASLSDVQKQLSETFGIKMTYMDVRFLVIDLNLELEEPKEEVAPPATDEANASDEPAADANAPLGGVSVEVDRLQKPGALVSGTVRFSDGVTASWAVDQMGRLGLESPEEGYQPPEEDMQEFQNGLRSALQSRGLA